MKHEEPDASSFQSDHGEHPDQPAAMGKRALRRRVWWFAGGLLLATILLYGLLVGLMMLDEPAMSVDYVAKLNEPAAAVSESDRAWPIYREAFITADMANLDIEILEVKSNGLRSRRRVCPDDDAWEQATVLLDKHADLLDALRLGGTKPGLGLMNWVGEHEYAERDALALFGKSAAIGYRSQLTAPQPPTAWQRIHENYTLSMLLPSLGQLRNSSKMLAVDMRRAVLQGDTDRWVANLEAMLGLARQSRETPTVINDLVAHSILIMAYVEAAQTLHQHPTYLRDEDLVLLAQRSEFVATTYDMPVLTGERYMMYDTLQRIYNEEGSMTYLGLRFLEEDVVDTYGMAPNDMGEPMGKSVFRAVKLPFASLARPNGNELKAEHDRLIGLAESHAARPLWETLGVESEFQKQLDAWQNHDRDQVRYMLLLMLLPNIDSVIRTVKVTSSMYDCLGVAVALERYRRDHDRYPGSLGALVPAYLPSEPVDHSSGLPLGYRLVDGRPTLYGRGRDGDDDGGTPSDEAGDVWPKLAEQGDWVLYPPLGR